MIFSEVAVIYHTNHVIAREQFLQKLCLLVLNSFDDKLVVISNVEDTATCSGVGQFSQWLMAQRQLVYTQPLSTSLFYHHFVKEAMFHLAFAASYNFTKLCTQRCSRKKWLNFGNHPYLVPNTSTLFTDSSTLWDGYFSYCLHVQHHGTAAWVAAGAIYRQ